MPQTNYYIGAKRGLGTDMKDISLVVGTAPAGTAVDMELNVQISNINVLTGVTKKDVKLFLENVLRYMLSNPRAGFDLPPL